MLYVLNTYRYFVRYNDVFILYLLSTIICFSHFSQFTSNRIFLRGDLIIRTVPLQCVRIVSHIVIGMKRTKELQNCNRYE